MLGIHDLLNRSRSASPTALAPGASEFTAASDSSSFELNLNYGNLTPEPLLNGETPISEPLLNEETPISKTLANEASGSLVAPCEDHSYAGPQPSKRLGQGARLASKVETGPGLTVNTLGRRVTKLHRSRIHPAALKNIRLIDIALRRKSTVKRASNPDTFGLKLHRKFLEAGLRVRLVLSPSIYEIFRQLTPATSRGQTLFSMEFDSLCASLRAHDLSGELLDARALHAVYPGRRRSRDSPSDPRDDPTSQHPFKKSNGRAKGTILENPGLGSVPELGKVSGKMSRNGSGSKSPGNGQIFESIPENARLPGSTMQEETSSPNGQNPPREPPPPAMNIKDESAGPDLLFRHNAPFNDKPAPKQEFLSQSPSRHVDQLPAVLETGKLETRVIRLIDSNLVDLAGVPSKVLKLLRYDLDDHGIQPHNLVGTFNCLDTAVASVFKIQRYSLVRVTKSASTNLEPSVLVKLETAHPGDPALIDDDEYIEDMVTSLGRPRTLPTNLFLKKVVARPRYKVDMKLYFVPYAESMSLYVDLRILERDLINGVVDVNSEPDRMLYTTFDPVPVLQHVLDLILQSDRHLRLYTEDDPLFALHVPNHMTDNLLLYMCTTPLHTELEGYSSGSSLNSHSSVFSRAGSSASASLASSVENHLKGL